jgi:hypothetical protein
MTTSVEVLQVIKTISTAGFGTPESPLRPIYQYWTMTGELIWTDDRHKTETRAFNGID